MTCVFNYLITDLHITCRDCNKGPVVLGSASNDEPTLNGKCLLCFKLYNQFQQTTRELANVKTTAMTLANRTIIGSFIGSKRIGYSCNFPLLSSIGTFKLDSILDRVEDRNWIALLLDRALPTPIGFKSHFVLAWCIWQDFKCKLSECNEIICNTVQSISFSSFLPSLQSQ